jgi:TRAP-type C4-dicarboxylate transport system permease small subunit
MKAVLQTFFEILDFIDDLVKKLCILFAGVMTAVIILQVLFRYVVNRPLTWTEELARFLLAWIGFTACSSLIKDWSNVSVDVFIGRLRPKAKAITLLAIKLGMLLLCTYVLVDALRIIPAIGLAQSSPALGIKMLVPQSSVIAGFTLMDIQLVGVILKDVQAIGGRND